MIRNGGQTETPGLAGTERGIRREEEKPAQPTTL